MPEALFSPASPSLRSKVISCRHCGDAVPAVRRSHRDAEARKFCCEGCASVYRLLQDLALGETYYALKAGTVSPLKPEMDSGDDHSALDEPPFRSASPAESELDFFLEGIHCTACVWVLERLPQFDSTLLGARLDLGRSVLRVRVSSEGRFANVMKLILRLGYRPHPLLTEGDAAARLRTEDRKTLRRIGVAAFAAMNVMVYSVSLYRGVGGREGELFRILSLATALPALSYSAWPFYVNAVRALRARRISIDLPISIALIGGYLESLRQTFHHSNLLYLDSLTSLVFLMLMSRYVLGRLERAELSKSGLLQALLPARVYRMGENPAEIRAEELKVSDVFSMGPGMRVPADGRISAGGGTLDLSFLTGESKPFRVSVGDLVFAGSRFIEGEAEVRVMACGQATRLGEMQTRLQAFAPRENARAERSDRWAQVFLAVVFGFAILLFLVIGRTDPGESIRRSLSLLIIACPCALALAAPLTLARAFRLAASRGIFLRDPEVLDRLLLIKEIVLDKTGTLTEGSPSIVSWEWSSSVKKVDENFLLSVAYSLEESARHPFARAILRHLEHLSGVRSLSLEVEAEASGTGRTARIDSLLYRIGRPTVDESSADSVRSQVEFSRDGAVLAKIEFEDTLRDETPEVISRLKALGLRLRILSGDQETVVDRVAKRLGISHWRARMSPLDKKSFVDRLQSEGSSVLAVGDGVNDSLALRSASVGVAITRNEGTPLESALSSANVVLLGSNLGGLSELFFIARQYERTLRRNVIFSAIYNLIGASFAVSGFVHPLVAAIAMPVSALTVFLSTAYGLRSVDRKGEK